MSRLIGGHAEKKLAGYGRGASNWEERQLHAGAGFGGALLARADGDAGREAGAIQPMALARELEQPADAFPIRAVAAHTVAKARIAQAAAADIADAGLDAGGPQRPR